tara:strand:- start:4285 stop:4734 length:450 start_codon:yes stop_codon:yes gene_type:complete
MILLYLFISFIVNPTKIYINLEKPNNLIIHTGITIKNDTNKIRYDFRAFNDNNNYITTPESRKNISLMFPKLNKKFLQAKGIGNDIDFIYSKELYLGTSNYSIDEIIELEKDLNKKYILGFNDCRHYVNNLCILTLNKEIPIWNLEKLL